jgi:soluble cytochrome b562
LNGRSEAQWRRWAIADVASPDILGRLKMNLRRTIIVLGCASLAATAAACLSGKRIENDPAPPTLADKRHWVHDQRLREIMSSLVLEQPWPERIDDRHVNRRDEETRAALSDAKKLARALARTSKEIPGLVAAVPMSEADRRSFQAQAETLFDQAQRLRRIAEQGDVKAMQEALFEIDATCSSCHTRFRDFSGLLGPRETRRLSPQWNGKTPLESGS